jgi:transcriptional regulator with XRE-family HTH domain
VTAQPRSAQDFNGLPQRIATVRRRLGLSQRAFAAILGVGRNVAIRWEGDYHRPSAARLKRIAKLGGVTPEWLLHGGEGRGKRRDRQWEEAVTALQVAWGDRRRRAALLLVLRAVAGGRASRPVRLTREPSGQPVRGR